MRTIPAGIAAALAAGAATLSLCWKGVRRDGQVFGFTEHDRDLVLGGVTYQAATGFTRNAMKGSGRLDAIGDTSVQGVIDSAVVTEEDLAAGVWDAARVTVYLADWTTLETLILGTYRVGEIEQRLFLTGGMWTAELRGLADQLRAQLVELYTPSCRAQFGDSRCGIGLGGVTVATAVTGVSSRQTFACGLGGAGHLYVNGLCTFTSGANAGLTVEVLGGSGDTLTLFFPTAWPITVGDGVALVQGCDKTFATCRDRWNNVVNFRGEPHVPGLDSAVRYPEPRG